MIELALTLRAHYEEGPTAVALPAGTRVNDALLVWGYASPFTVSDSRLTWHEPHVDPFGSSGGFWVGRATTLDPITLGGTIGGGARSYGAFVATFAGSVDLERVSIVHAGEAAIHEIPAIAGEGNAAILMGLGLAGIGGANLLSVTGGATWTDPEGGSSYHNAAVSTTDANQITGPVTVEWDTVNPGSFATVIVGATLGRRPSSCRKYPRDDGLGVGAGRHYPPPSSRQRSSRGVGYY